MADKNFKVKSGLQVPSLTTAGPVVTDNAGNVTSSSTLPISQGGTGQTTADNALNALLPIQGGGNINKYLQTNGTNTQWNTVLQPVYAADAPSEPLVGQVWIESDSSSDSFDPNIIRRKTITATAGQTTFTTDLEFIQGYEQVYFNGMLLLRTSDYTTPTNTSVVLAAAAAAGDIVEILSITNLNSINAATTTTNTFTGNQIVNARIGIGVSNPLNDIHIYKASGNSVIRAESAGSTGNDSGTLNLVGGSFSLQNIMYGAGGAYTISNGNAHYFGTQSSSPAIFWTNSTERMRIDASGNVGIGITNPSYKLHISGGVGVVAGSGRILFNSNSQTLPTSDDGGLVNLPFGFGGNLTGGQAEMNIFNNVNLTSTSDSAKGFTFIQKTGASTYEMPLRITGNGFLQQNDILGARDTGLVRRFSAPHISSNRGARFTVGLDDGSFSGMVVTNSASVNNVYNSQYISFVTHEGGISVAERVRIDSFGNVGIGTTSPTELLHVNGTARATRWRADNQDAAGPAFSFQNSVNAGIFSPGTNLIGFSTVSTERMRIDTNGYLLVGYTSSNGAFRLQVNSQIFATSSTIATSDGRYKENVNTLESGLNIIDSLRPVSFTWKEHEVHNFPEGKTVGFIAQEVQEALADYDWVDNLIKTNYNEEAEEEFLGIAEGNLIPLLVAAVKELKSRVETLEASNV